MSLSRSLTVQFYNVLNTQKALGDSFADLAQKSPELNEEFNANAETQKNLAKYADTLLSKWYNLNFIKGVYLKKIFFSNFFD